MAGLLLRMLGRQAKAQADGKPTPPVAPRGRRNLYAAARVDRSTGDWTPITGQDVNDLISASSPMIRARVRQLVRDFPIFARAVKILVDNCVGTGIQMQAGVRLADGQPNTAVNDRIEAAWARWAEEADAGGRLHLHDLHRLAKRQEAESGEYLLARVRLAGPRRYLPLAYQMYEAEWLTETGARPGGKNTVVQGVEIDTRTGAAVAYWLEDPNSWGKPIRIAAVDMIHGYEVLRPGQLRGVSPFAPAVLLAHTLSGYISAESEAARATSSWVAFVKSPDLSGMQAMRADEASTDESGRRVEEMGMGLIEHLRPGDDISLVDPTRPNQAMGDFTALLIRLMGVAVGVTYERLSGDYDQISYSNLRGIRLDEAQDARPAQQRFIRQCVRPMYLTFLDELALRGDVLPADYWVRRRDYQRHQALAPGYDSVDPLRETNAWLSQIANGLRSPQEIVGSRGRDLEEVLHEIAQAQAMAEALGLNVSWTPRTSVSTSPSKLGA